VVVPFGVADSISTGAQIQNPPGPVWRALQEVKYGCLGAAPAVIGANTIEPRELFGEAASIRGRSHTTLGGRVPGTLH